MLILLVLFFAHYLGDFVFQTDYMATNKSKSWKALNLHVLVYSMVLLALSLPFIYLFAPVSNKLGSIGSVIHVVGLNAIVHLLIDAVTSRINRRLLEKNLRTYFWWVLGFDQYIHLATLLLLSHRFLGV